MIFNLSSNTSIILEIRDRELRLLAFNNGALRKATRKYLPPHIMHNCQVVNIQGLGDEIANLIKNESGNIHSLNIILSGLRTTCRTIEVPDMPGNLKRKFIERQMNKEMPFSAKELYISSSTRPFRN